MRRFLLVLLIIFACEPLTEQRIEKSQLKEGLYKVRIIENRWDEPKYELYAEEVVGLRDSSIAYNVKIYFFDENGNRVSHLTSDSGIYYHSTMSMRAWGNVKFENLKDSSILETKSIFWDNESELIFTHDSVKIKSKRRIVEGVGLRSDRYLKRIIIGGGVWGREER